MWTQRLFTFMLLLQRLGFNSIYGEPESPSILMIRKKLEKLKINNLSSITELRSQGKWRQGITVYQGQKPSMEPATGRIT